MVENASKKKKWEKKLNYKGDRMRPDKTILSSLIMAYIYFLENKKN